MISIFINYLAEIMILNEGLFEDGKLNTNTLETIKEQNYLDRMRRATDIAIGGSFINFDGKLAVAPIVTIDDSKSPYYVEITYGNDNIVKVAHHEVSNFFNKYYDACQATKSNTLGARITSINIPFNAYQRRDDYAYDFTPPDPKNFNEYKHSVPINPKARDFYMSNAENGFFAKPPADSEDISYAENPKFIHMQFTDAAPAKAKNIIVTSPYDTQSSTETPAPVETPKPETSTPTGDKQVDASNEGLYNWFTTQPTGQATLAALIVAGLFGSYWLYKKWKSGRKITEEDKERAQELNKTNINDVDPNLVSQQVSI